MKQHILILFIALAPWLSQAQTVSVLPSNSNIQYAGRMDFSNPDAPTFSISGASITATFNGTGISINLSSSGTSYIYVIIDGNDNPYEREVITVASTNVEIVLASGLSSGTHTVTVVKTNPYKTKLTFNGFTITGSGILNPPARKSRKIEFYGDSNPAGYSTWDVYDSENKELSGAYYSFPGITARMLDADHSNFSAPSWGVTLKNRRKNMNDAYNKIHIDDRASASNTWDFANNYWNFFPDVVVINLGINDRLQGASQAEVMEGWDQLVTALRTHYPNVPIVMSNSYGLLFNEPANYVDQFVAQRHAMGDTEISYVKFPWLFAQKHPVVFEYAGFANILATHIANVMGWETPALSPLSSFGENGNVGNGSFESSLIDGVADGWRPYSNQSYPEYINDPSSAYDGSSFIRCPAGNGVMHSNDASPGDVFNISVWAKVVAGGKAQLKYEFCDQGQNAINGGVGTVDASVGSAWQKISLSTVAAPEGTWQIRVKLDGIEGSTADFDLANMEKSVSEPVSVTGVSVSPTSANLNVNDVVQLTETVQPSNAIDKSVSWSSSNTSVATVDANGLVTAIAEGSATITVTTNDGEYTATSAINVTIGNPGSTMHVENVVEGTQSAGGPNNNGTATIYVEDNSGNPVANATVTGTFSGDFNETGSGVTGADGSVIIVTAGKLRGTPGFDFCVDDITHSSLNYASGDNVMTCSNGLKSTLFLSSIPGDNSNPIHRIYPNPVSSGNVTLQLNRTITNGVVNMYNSLGKLVLSKPIVGNELNLNIKGYKAGIYYISVKGYNSINFSKLIIK